MDKIHFAPPQSRFGMTYFNVNGYKYETDDLYMANQIIRKSKHKPGKAWAMLKIEYQKYLKRQEAHHEEMSKM